MGRNRTSYKNSLLYAKELIEQGENIETACKLSAHRFDEKSKQIYRRLRKEEKLKNKNNIIFYEGPIYLVNINNKKDIKKQIVAIKLNTKLENSKIKLYIENFYSKDNYKGFIKNSDWENLFKTFSNDNEYNNYINEKRTN
jgi:hypothetical protein